MLDKQINQPQSNPEEWINAACFHYEDWETEAQRDLRGFKEGKDQQLITEHVSHSQKDRTQTCWVPALSSYLSPAAVSLV